MVKKEVYQEVESKLMLLESENREMKFTLEKAKKQLGKIEKDLELALL